MALQWKGSRHCSQGPRSLHSGKEYSPLWELLVPCAHHKIAYMMQTEMPRCSSSLTIHFAHMSALQPGLIFSTCNQGPRLQVSACEQRGNSRMHLLSAACAANGTRVWPRAGSLRPCQASAFRTDKEPGIAETSNLSFTHCRHDAQLRRNQANEQVAHLKYRLQVPTPGSVFEGDASSASPRRPRAAGASVATTIARRALTERPPARPTLPGCPAEPPATLSTRAPVKP